MKLSYALFYYLGNLQAVLQQQQQAAQANMMQMGNMKSQAMFASALGKKEKPGNLVAIPSWQKC